MTRFTGTLAAAVALGLGLGAQAAHAGPLSFEDAGMVAGGGWQLNSIVAFLPSTQRVAGQQVLQLAPSDRAMVQQFSQEIRFGVSDRLTVRTTVPYGALQSGLGASLSGLGDWEVFAKGLLWGGEDAPFEAAVGLQALWATSGPAAFSMAGGTVLSPSLMLAVPTSLGNVSASIAYFRAFERATDDGRVQPSDTTVLGLSWDRDVAERWNVAVELVGTEGSASRLEGVATPDSAYRQVVAGPSVAYAFAPGQALQVGVQVPLLREGAIAASQPLTALVQYSLDL